MELDPSYSDVIVKRWEAKTGKAAVLEATAQTFAEVTATRGTGASRAGGERAQIQDAQEEGHCDGDYKNHDDRPHG